MNCFTISTGRPAPPPGGGDGERGARCVRCPATAASRDAWDSGRLRRRRDLFAGSDCLARTRADAHAQPVQAYAQLSGRTQGREGRYARLHKSLPPPNDEPLRRDPVHYSPRRAKIPQNPARWRGENCPPVTRPVVSVLPRFDGTGALRVCLNRHSLTGMQTTGGTGGRRGAGLARCEIE